MKSTLILSWRIICFALSRHLEAYFLIPAPVLPLHFKDEMRLPDPDENEFYNSEDFIEGRDQLKSTGRKGKDKKKNTDIDLGLTPVARREGIKTNSRFLPLT